MNALRQYPITRELISSFNYQNEAIKLFKRIGCYFRIETTKPHMGWSGFDIEVTLWNDLGGEQDFRRLLQVKKKS